MIVPKTVDGRVVFMLPWLGNTIAGTTDAPCGVTPTPQPSEEEIRFILDAIADFLTVKVCVLGGGAVSVACLCGGSFSLFTCGEGGVDGWG